MGLEPTTVGLRVQRSTDWASRAWMSNPFCYLISDLFLETVRTCSNSNSQLTWWNNLKILSPRNLPKFRLSFLSDKNFCWLASASRHSRNTKWTTLNFHIGILLFKMIHKLWIVIVTPVEIKLIVTNPIHFGQGRPSMVDDQSRMTSVTEQSSSEWLSVNLVDLSFKSRWSV